MIFQRRQKTDKHMKMFSITHVQGNTNQDCSDFASLYNRDSQWVCHLIWEKNQQHPRYHLTPVMVATIDIKTKTGKYVSKDIEKLEHCYIISRRRQWHPTPVLLPRKSHGRRSLVGCSPWGRKESDTTERLHFPFSLSCIGEGNGNPLQCSCLENPRDGKPGGLPSMGCTESDTTEAT